MLVVEVMTLSSVGSTELNERFLFTFLSVSPCSIFVVQEKKCLKTYHFKNWLCSSTNLMFQNWGNEEFEVLEVFYVFNSDTRWSHRQSQTPERPFDLWTAARPFYTWDFLWQVCLLGDKWRVMGFVSPKKKSHLRLGSLYNEKS